MSLAEQIQRVDGSQNDILKTLLSAFGVTVGENKIDQLAALAKAAPLLAADGILPSSTKTALGLPENATVNDAFLKINTRLNMISSGLASVTLSLKYDSGIPAKNVYIKNLIDEGGSNVKTNESGVAVGYVTAGSVQLSVSDYIDISPWNLTFEAEKGQSYSKEATLSRISEKDITKTTTFMFSEEVSEYDVCAVGGGGGGAGSWTYYGGDRNYQGGGGGGGGYIENLLNVTPIYDKKYTATIAAGGSRGEGNDITSGYAYVKGGKGGTTSLSVNGQTVVSANGGNGGGPTNGGSDVISGGTGNGNGGTGIEEDSAYSSAGTPGGNATGYKFGDPSLGVPGGGGGGGGTNRDHQEKELAGGSPNGGAGGVKNGSVSFNNIAASMGKTPGGGGGGGGAGGRASSSGSGDNYYQNGAKGGNGAMYLRWRFK